MEINDFSKDIIIQTTKADLIDAFKIAISEMQVNPVKKWMTLKEVSTYTGYKPPTLYKYVQEKTIPFYKRNGRLMFLKSDLDAWLNEVPVKESTNVKPVVHKNILYTDKEL